MDYIINSFQIFLHYTHVHIYLGNKSARTLEIIKAKTLD